MKQNPEYLLEKIEEEYYLLPIGQERAEFGHQVEVSELVAFLWEQLSQNRSKEELLESARQTYQWEASDEDKVSQLIDDTLDKLLQRHILLDEKNKETKEFTCEARRFALGGLSFSFHGPEWSFPPVLEEYFGTEAQSDGEWDNLDYLIDVVEEIPRKKINGRIVFRNEHFILTESPSGYLFLFPEGKAVYELHMNLLERKIEIYCKNSMKEIGSLGILNLLEYPFLLLAQTRGLYAIHSASILYRDKVWIFSALSGTGKTTHTDIWKRLFTEVRDVNGDLNLLGFEGKIPYVYGIPWCGTSRRFTNNQYELGGIIFLERSLQNEVCELSRSQQIVSMSNRFFTPAFSKELLEENLAFAKKLAGSGILIRKLYCNMEDEAAEIMKCAIDSFVEKLV